MATTTIIITYKCVWKTWKIYFANQFGKRHCSKNGFCLYLCVEKAFMAMLFFSIYLSQKQKHRMCLQKQRFCHRRRCHRCYHQLFASISFSWSKMIIIFFFYMLCVHERTFTGTKAPRSFKSEIEKTRHSLCHIQWPKTKANEFIVYFRSNFSPSSSFWYMFSDVSLADMYTNLAL